MGIGTPTLEELDWNFSRTQLTIHDNWGWLFSEHWKDWCWSWGSNILATWCKEPAHWKRPCCWKRLRSGGTGGPQRMRRLDEITDSMDLSLSKQTPGGNEGQGSLACSSPWGCKESAWLNHWTLVSKRKTPHPWVSPRVTGLREEASPHPICSLSIPITHISTRTGPTAPI